MTVGFISLRIDFEDFAAYRHENTVAAFFFGMKKSVQIRIIRVTRVRLVFPHTHTDDTDQTDIHGSALPHHNLNEQPGAAAVDITTPNHSRSKGMRLAMCKFYSPPLFTFNLRRAHCADASEQCTFRTSQIKK